MAIHKRFLPPNHFERHIRLAVTEIGIDVLEESRIPSQFVALLFEPPLLRSRSLHNVLRCATETMHVRRALYFCLCFSTDLRKWQSNKGNFYCIADLIQLVKPPTCHREDFVIVLIVSMQVPFHFQIHWVKGNCRRTTPFFWFVSARIRGILLSPLV